MLSNRQLAMLIPAKHRLWIIENNLIYKAIAIQGDVHMEQLRIIWATAVDPHGNNDAECTICLTRILRNYRELEPTLIELVKEDQLLDL